MTVERIGPLDLPSNSKKAEKASRPRAKSDVDSINVSQEARSKSEILKAVDDAKVMARTTADVRLDRVEEVKRKLQDPSYPSQEVIEKTAEGILKSFGI